jgi:hypothetical protein
MTALVTKNIPVNGNLMRDFPGYELDRIDMPEEGEMYLFFNVTLGKWTIQEEYRRYSNRNDLECQIIVKKRYVEVTANRLFEIYGQQIYNLCVPDACWIKLSPIGCWNGSKELNTRTPNFNSETHSYQFIDSIVDGKITWSNTRYKLKV